MSQAISLQGHLQAEQPAIVSRTFSSHFSFVSGIIECLPNAFKKQKRNLIKQLRKMFNNQGEAITVKFSPRDFHLRCGRQRETS